MTGNAPEDETGMLAGLDLEALKERWVDLYRLPPPRHISRELLMQAIAYRVQVTAHGGLSRSMQARLRGTKRGAGSRDTRTLPKPSVQHRFKPGTRLIREWQGKVHEVTVGDDGSFVHQGVAHASLSSVARAITGTRWSGPAFFGLKASREAKCDGSA